MALPLGKKSLLQIERRVDPHRRVVELTTLLEWLLRLAKPPAGELPEDPSLPEVIRAYSWERRTAERLDAAVAVRTRLLHCLPGLVPVTPAEAEQAAQALSEATRAVIDTRLDQTPVVPHIAEAASDPLRELDLCEDQEATCRERDGAARVRAIICRLDTLSGYRAPFDSDSLSPRQLSASLTRYHRHVTDIPVDVVRRALDETQTSQCEAILQAAADNLQRAFQSLSTFDAQWRTAAGALPWGAIALEPDIQTRLRLLGTLVEHQLAWISPALPADQGRSLVECADAWLLDALLDDKSHLVPDVDDLRVAWNVRARLLRVVPSSRPLTAAELDASERTLWRAVFELRRHCHLEHADALSNFADIPLATLPCAVLTEIRAVQSQFCEMLRRLEMLALAWEGRHPGCWSVPSADDHFPSPVQVLQRHPSPDVRQRLETIDAARKFFRLRADQRELLKPLPELPHQAVWRTSLTSVIDLLEHELSWCDRPTTGLPSRPRPVAPAAPRPAGPAADDEMRQLDAGAVPPIAAAPAPARPSAPSPQQVSPPHAPAVKRAEQPRREGFFDWISRLLGG